MASMGESAVIFLVTEYFARRNKVMSDINCIASYLEGWLDSLQAVFILLLSFASLFYQVILTAAIKYHLGLLKRLIRLPFNVGYVLSDPPPSNWVTISPKFARQFFSPFSALFTSNHTKKGIVGVQGAFLFIL